MLRFGNAVCPAIAIGIGVPAVDEGLWVEPVGKIVIARVRGETTENLLQRCQARVLALLSDSASRCVLYDLLEAHVLSADVNRPGF